jgi:hypothetical protein
MSYPIHIWSKAFAPSVDTDPFSIQVEKQIWEESMRREGGRRKFCRILHPSGLDDWIAPLGQPVDPTPTESEETPVHSKIYMPLWMIDSAHLDGDGEETVLEIIEDEYFPEATKIVFRVIDSAIYNADIKVELEQALSSLGVIREHSTLHIPVSALGGYPVEVFVSKTEPANVVLCDGEEVAVEFEEPVDQIAPPPPRPPTPIPEPPPTLTTDLMVPEGFISQPQRQTTGFQAFQGEGRLLGGSNVNIPEWRRGLPPPKR